jgi:hypothetical protein
MLASKAVNRLRRKRAHSSGQRIGPRRGRRGRELVEPLLVGGGQKRRRLGANSASAVAL